MFGLFNTSPPLSTRQRAELELLMRRLVERLGESSICSAVMVADVGELSLDLTDEESLMISAAAEVRRRMGLTDANVELEIVRADDIDAAAVYRTGDLPVISIADVTLQDPLQTVVTLAHEYSHHILLGGGNTRESNWDERLTDLIPICFGLGILQSDASSSFQAWTVGTSHLFTASKSGYLNSEEIGYALALLARFRGESNPDWSRALRDDTKVTMKRALKYFSRHERDGGQLLFDADQIPCVESTRSKLVNWLAGNDPAFALAATWRLAGMDEFDESMVDCLLAASESSDLDVAPMAITLLAGTESYDDRVVRRVTSLMGDRRPSVAMAAMRAARALGIDMSDHVVDMCAMLSDPAADFDEIVRMIRDLGADGQRADEFICRQLARSMRDVDDDRTRGLIDCLRNICSDPAATIEKLMSRSDGAEAKQWLARSH